MNMHNCCLDTGCSSNSRQAVGMLPTKLRWQSCSMADSSDNTVADNNYVLVAVDYYCENKS